MKVDLLPIIEKLLEERRKDDARETRRNNADKKEPDLIEVLDRRHREQELLDKFAHDYVKLKKPEEKKDPKKDNWSKQDVMFFLILSFPFVGPLYYNWLQRMFH